MRTLGILLILATWQPVLGSVHTQTYPNPERLSVAIWFAEGGPRAKVPYGVLSVPVANEKEAREITLRSIENNYQRWLRSNQHLDFVDFMALRWCPDDPWNWAKNVRFYMRKFEGPRLKLD